MNDAKNEMQKRDAETLTVLGVFFAVMGLLVLIGTYWALGKTSAVIVSVASGLVLLLIGTGMFCYARRRY